MGLKTCCCKSCCMWWRPGTGEVINWGPATCACDTGVLGMLFSEAGGGECSCSRWSDAGLEFPLPLASRSCSHVRSRSNCCCCCSFSTFSREAACCKRKEEHVLLGEGCVQVWKQLVHVIKLIDFGRAERLQTAALGPRK